jgi:hypothetical protein
MPSAWKPLDLAVQIIAILDPKANGLWIWSGQWWTVPGYGWADGFGEGHCRWHWQTALWMALADGYLWTRGKVQIQENKPLHLVHDLLALLALPLKSNIQGEHAIYKCT